MRRFNFVALAVIALNFSLFGWEYETERLSNGMKLILIEDHAFPLVSVTVVVNAGAAYEDVFTNGLSHFLEHLIFDGTKTQSRQEIWERFDTKGVYYNAFTRKDFVAFIITSPRDFIEDAVENQADMLLNSILPVKEFEKERKVVIEEMTKDRDKPEEVADEYFCEKAFSGTPYERPVLGYENTINTVTREEVFDFYQSRYVPNNMTAIVIGDFEPDEILNLFERVYGAIPPKRVSPLKKTKNFQPIGRTLYKKYFKTERKYVKVGFSAPLWNEKDAPIFSILQDLLNRENSPLVESLTKGDNPVAQEVNCEYRMHRGLSSFIVTMVLPPEQNTKEAIERLTTILDELKRKGFKNDYIRDVQRSLKAEEVYSTENYTYLGMFLSYWIPFGGIEKRKRFLEEKLKVNNSQIKEALRKYWTPLNYVAISVEPKPIAKKSKARRQVKNVKRDILSNGTTVIALQDSGSPILAVHILIGNRLLFEPEGKNGVSHFVMQMLDKGTKDMTKEEIAHKMDILGIKLKTVDNPYMPFDDYYNSKDYAYIRFQVLDENRDEGLKLLHSLLVSPSFPKEEMEITRRKIISLIRRELSSSRGIAKREFFRLLFGNTPLGRPLMGDTLSVKRITQEDLINYHKSAFSAGNLTIAIVGNGTPDSLISMVKNITRGLPEGVAPIKPPSAQPDENTRKVVQLKRGQAYIYEGMLIPSLRNPDAIPLKVLSLILSDRLHKELREKRGLAYRLGAGVEFFRDTGIFFISMGTRSKVAKESEKGIEEVIQSLFESPPTEDEIEKNVNSYWGHYLRFHQRRINRAYYLSYYEYLDKGYQFDLQQIREMHSVKPQDLINVAKKYLGKNRLYKVIAGDVD